MTMLRRWPRQLATLIAVPILGVALGAPGASAAPVVSLPFSYQTEHAGLTKAEAWGLQGRVDAYLAKTGGVQIAANKIEYQKAILTLTLPGETYARDIDAPRTNLATGCSYYWACLWRNANFSGDRINLYYCNTWVGIPWFASDGSWDNNQTPGTKMGIDPIGTINPYFAFPAHDIHSYGVHWSNIAAMTAC